MNGCGSIESIGLFHQKSLFLIMGDKGEEQPMSFWFLYSVALLECGIRTIPFFFLRSSHKLRVSHRKSAAVSERKRKINILLPETNDH